MITPPKSHQRPCRHRPRTARWPVAVAIWCGGLVALPASAQDTVTIGGSGRPSVEVNLDVLQGLGAPGAGGGARSGLLMPGEPRPERSTGARLSEPVEARKPAVAATSAARTADVEGTPRRRTPVPLRKRVAAASATENAPTPGADDLADLQALPLEPPAVPSPEPGDREPAAEAAIAEQPVPPPAETEPVPQETAALAPLAVPEDGTLAVVEFEGTSTRLTPSAEETLRRVATTLAQSEGRLQLKAFAGGGEATSGARRASLSRALAVRAYLIEQGVRSTRIDVRALGAAGDSGPPERVDVLYLAP